MIETAPCRRTAAATLICRAALAALIAPLLPTGAMADTPMEQALARLGAEKKSSSMHTFAAPGGKAARLEILEVTGEAGAFAKELTLLATGSCPEKDHFFKFRGEAAFHLTKAGHAWDFGKGSSSSSAFWHRHAGDGVLIGKEAADHWEDSWNTQLWFLGRRQDEACGFAWQMTRLVPEDAGRTWAAYIHESGRKVLLVAAGTPHPDFPTKVTGTLCSLAPFQCEEKVPVDPAGLAGDGYRVPGEWYWEQARKEKETREKQARTPVVAP